jgi:hypothetical protein
LTASELGGPLSDAALQLGVQLADLLFGLLPLGDVVELTHQECPFLEANTTTSPRACFFRIA